MSKDFVIGAVIMMILAAISVMPTTVANGLPGDFDGDGDRDLADLMYLVAHWNTQVGDSDWDPDTDFNGDGVCSIIDIMIFVTQYYLIEAIDVDVDVKPGSCPNPLNTKSKGLLPVAVCGTPDFDVSLIDPASVRLEGVVAPLRWSIEDVATPFDGELCECHDLTGDGIFDMTFKFDIQELAAAIAPVYDRDVITLALTGSLLEEAGGESFIGQDCVWILHGSELPI
jgi:hypothetical protein